MPIRREAGLRAPTADTPSTDLDLDEDEQMRLIRATGVLRPSEYDATLRSRSSVRVNPAGKPLVDLQGSDDGSLELDEPSLDEDAAADVEQAMREEDIDPSWLATPFAEQAVTSLLWDVATHKQYGEPATAALEARRIGNLFPGLYLLVFVSLRYPRHPVLRLFLFLSSLVGGSYMIYVVNRESYIAVMRRCPPIGILWVWACIQLDLLPAVISLAGVAAFVRYEELQIFF